MMHSMYVVLMKYFMPDAGLFSKDDFRGMRVSTNCCILKYIVLFKVYFLAAKGK